MNTKLHTLIHKPVLILMIIALALAALPAMPVLAAGLTDQPPPATATPEASGERIESAWARLQEIHARQGEWLDRAETFADNLQARIDRMNENGKDTSALQAALDAFKGELKNAHPVYESAKGIINSHKGFDTQGKITDQEQAVETLRELGGKIREVHQMVGEPGRALREAIRAYLEAQRGETS